MLLAERAPWHDRVPDEVDWSTVTHFERRLARRFGGGRVWLAGRPAFWTANHRQPSSNWLALASGSGTSCSAST
jgi:hypothetical protein